MEDNGRTQHGFPRGYRFVPEELEIIRLLDDKLAGRPLPYPLHNIFHDIRIRDFHPAELYEAYKEHEEDGFIYFFSIREFPTARGSKQRPARGAKHGAWKASGGGKAVSTMTRGGVDVGQKLTLVFYDKVTPTADDKSPKNTGKTDWGMHEFTRIIGPGNKVADLALYRLYKMNKGKKKKMQADLRAATSSRDAKSPNRPTAASSSSSSWCHPAGETSQFMANQLLDGVASSSRAHDYADEYSFGVATSSAPGPSSSAVSMDGAGQRTSLLPMTRAQENYQMKTPQQQAAHHFGATSPQRHLGCPGPVVAGWSEQQLVNMAPAPPAPALDDEFNAFCKGKPLSTNWLPMLSDLSAILKDPPMLKQDEDSEYYKLNFDCGSMGPMDDEALLSTIGDEMVLPSLTIEDADASNQVRRCSDQPEPLDSSIASEQQQHARSS